MDTTTKFPIWKKYSTDPLGIFHCQNFTVFVKLFKNSNLIKINCKCIGVIRHKYNIYYCITHDFLYNNCRIKIILMSNTINILFLF